MSQAGGAPLSM